VSNNIYICAEREQTVVKVGSTLTQYLEFDSLTTPNEVTYEILYAEDDVQAYRDWVLSTGNIEHAEKFDKWVEDRRREGYEIVFYMT
jgi:hypothetical protein